MAQERDFTIVVVGGYGVFGGRLARLLIERGDARVLVAGRSLPAARAFCTEHGGEPLALDRDANVEAVLTHCEPAVVIDAAGPFQAYGKDPYRLARAALQAGAHYLDLSDDADFTAGIVQLDAQARAQARVVLSGVSSVPAISAAAVRSLSRGLACIDHIDSVILPGNRAPRGLSVMRAILAQAGRPMQLWRGGRWTQAQGWGGLRRVRLDGLARPLEPRWASLIGCPDLGLFPAHFKARSVTFRAGLELSVLHLGLSALAWLPRWGWIRSLAGWARPLRWLADRFRPIGSDRGGMRVSVTGRDARGRLWVRNWTLVAEQGMGPFVPTLPAFTLIPRLRAGAITPGARPCLEEVSLAEIETAGRARHMDFARSARAASTLYEGVLGEAWTRLPPAVRALHDVVDQLCFEGESRVIGGSHPLSSLVRWIMGFPPAGEAVPVRVTMECRDGAEHWQRQFGRHRFSSVLSRYQGDPPGHLRERFGAMQFELSLPADASGLQMPLHRGWFLGIPLPKFLLPRSETREFVDGQGRFNFDVDVSLPLIGRVVRYQGWLLPVRDTLSS